jgi:hypothetical protein
MTVVFTEELQEFDEEAGMNDRKRTAARTGSDSARERTRNHRGAEIRSGPHPASVPEETRSIGAGVSLRLYPVKRRSATDSPLGLSALSKGGVSGPAYPGTAGRRPTVIRGILSSLQVQSIPCRRRLCVLLFPVALTRGERDLIGRP